MAEPGQQLPLKVQLRDEATLGNFLVTDSLRPLMPLLEGLCAGSGEPLLYLHGTKNSGKSHLLQACCHQLGSAAIYLPLAELVDYPPEQVLADMETMALVCLDDMDVIAGVGSWERGLFHFFNRARAAGCRLLLAASAAPRSLGTKLPDLQSRLSWGLVFHLPGYSDADKEALLILRARQRGLSMSAEVARYVVSRAPRGLAQLFELLDRVDERSLAEQRGITVPFLRQVLGPSLS